MKNLIKLLSITVLLVVANIAQAEWANLDAANSSVSFVSVKNKDIAEVHVFESVQGTISKTGEVNISIDAASLNTAIQIRDERMREHLFKIVKFPAIEISAQVDLDSLEKGSQRVQLPATLSLVGKELPIQLDVLVNLGKKGLTVSSAKPVLVSASQAGLTAGVAKLAELAGGISIGNSVPVSFSLNFNRLSKKDMKRDSKQKVSSVSKELKRGPRQQMSGVRY